jgi:ADP-ribosylglycohydrolase
MNRPVPVCFGAIAGDVIGSRFEHNRPKHPNFILVKSTCFFTDDTVLTIAVAAALLRGGDYGKFIREYALRYPNAGFGSYFRRWMASENPQPYNSFGNGSAMRVSPVAWASTPSTMFFEKRNARLSLLTTIPKESKVHRR